MHARRRFSEQHKQGSDQRFGVVQLSSIVTNPYVVYRPNLAMYSASKVFNRDFSVACMINQVGEKPIDTLIVKPAFVTTQMCGFNKSRTSVLPEMCSFGTLTALGNMEQTGGAFKHTLLNVTLSALSPLASWMNTKSKKKK